MDNQNKRKLPKDLQLSDDQLEKRLKEGQNPNTVRSEKKADQAFTRYLQENGADDVEYWYFEEPELDNWLAKFWLCVRKGDESDSDGGNSDKEEDPDKKNKMYSANTLRSFRYGLNRVLRSKGHLYKITEKGTSFQKSDEAFKLAIKELKSEGKAEIHSYPEITEEGTVDLDRSCVVFYSGINDIFFGGLFERSRLATYRRPVPNIK